VVMSSSTSRTRMGCFSLSTDGCGFTTIACGRPRIFHPLAAFF
jgi:hypothetical protein